MSRNNFFAALNDDSEDEATAVKKEQNEAQNKSKKQNNKKKVDAPASNAPNATANSKSKKEKEGMSSSNPIEETGAVESSNRQSRSGGNPKRGGRGSGYVGGRDRRGKREYERHSGQKASRDVERKGGAGGHNWGKAGEDEEPIVADAEGEEKATETQVDAEANVGAEQEGEEVPQEPEIKEKTLEEYEAERAAKRQGEAFKPIETVKVEKINDGTEYKKDLGSQGELFGGSTKPRRVRDRKKEKNIVETAFTVKDNSFTDDRGSGFRGRGRGGRGRGRGRGAGAGPGASAGAGAGGRGRGGSRSYRSNQRIDPTSSLEFPALGAA